MDEFLQAFFPAVQVKRLPGDLAKPPEDITITAGVTLPKATRLAESVARIRLHNEAVATLLAMSKTLPNDLRKLNDAYQIGQNQVKLHRPYFSKEHVVVKAHDDSNFRLFDAFRTAVLEMRLNTKPPHIRRWIPRIVVLTDPYIARALKGHPVISDMIDVEIFGTPHMKMIGKLVMTISEKPAKPGEVDANCFGTLLMAPTVFTELARDDPKGNLTAKMKPGTDDDVELQVHPFYKGEHPAQQVKMAYEFITHRPVMKLMTIDGLK